MKSLISRAHAALVGFGGTTDVYYYARAGAYMRLFTYLFTYLLVFFRPNDIVLAYCWLVFFRPNDIVLAYCWRHQNHEKS
jgi:hypothetical protein